MYQSSSVISAIEPPLLRVSRPIAACASVMESSRHARHVKKRVLKILAQTRKINLIMEVKKGFEILN